MLAGILFFEILSFFLSLYVAAHFICPPLIQWMITALFFLSFNGIFVLMRLTHAVFKGAREIVILFSFLSAVGLYAVLLFITNDLLLFWPPYGNFYFAHQLAITTFFGTGLILTALYAVWNTSHIVVRSYSLKTKKNVQARIAFISDLHIAPHTMSVARLQAILSKLTTLRPDFVVLGGDIIEMRPDYFMEHTISELFKRFAEQTPLIAVVGNHEYYGGQLAENIEALEQTGAIVLKDASHLFADKKILFIGRDDRINRHRKPLKLLLPDSADSFYTVVVDHDPSKLTEAASLPIDLQLSGHTHNGQIFPFNLLLKFIFINPYGYKRLNDTDTIVSAGIGTWGPLVRVGTRSEIVIADITSVSTS